MKITEQQTPKKNKEFWEQYIKEKANTCIDKASTEDVIRELVNKMIKYDEMYLTLSVILLDRYPKIWEEIEKIIEEIKDDANN